MDVKDVLSKRRELEKEIQALLVKFVSETEVNISDINFKIGNAYGQDTRIFDVYVSLDLNRRF